MPENAHQKVLVGIHAHTIDILTEGRQVITAHGVLSEKGVQISAITAQLWLFS